MRWKDQFQFVRKNMKKNKTRIFMTILATAMGCAFLIVLASVGFGLQKSVVDQVTQGRLMTEIQVPGKKEDDENGIKRKDIDYFETLDHVKTVTRRQIVEQQTIYNMGEYRAADGNAVVVDYPSEMKAGFELSKGRLPNVENEVVIGYDFANRLAKWDGKGDPPMNEDGTIKDDYKFQGDLINQTINMDVKKFDGEKEVTKEIPLKVVGITKKPTREWMRDQNVFISEQVLSDIELFTGTANGMINQPGTQGEVPAPPSKEDRTYNQVSVFADNVENVEGIADKLEAKNYFTYSVVNEMKQVNLMFLIVKSGLVFIGTIAIIIASIGIYNTMTMAVTERAPDIGIMKAIGANPSTIKRIFLIESSYIGLLGALFGTIVAYGISIGVNWLLPLILGRAFDEKPPADFTFSHIPFSLPLICISICLIVTIISGLRPASRATKVDVLKAMRREV